jgi:hypothetical protein
MAAQELNSIDQLATVPDPDPMADEDNLQRARRGKFRTPAFTRMRTDWRSTEDRMVVSQVQYSVEAETVAAFRDAYQLMHDVFERVRTPELTEEGAPVKDNHGFTVWKRTVSGGYEEDWSRLTHVERENFLFAITTRLFAWEQIAVDAWGEAMLAKAQYEERFSISYDSPVEGTIEDRNAVAKMDAAEERYYALFLTLKSRKFEAIVRSMDRLGQRLKDTLT